MREARFLLVGRDHPDVVGEFAGDFFEQLDAVRLDAVVVDDEDAVIAQFLRRREIGHSPVSLSPPRRT